MSIRVDCLIGIVIEFNYRCDYVYVYMDVYVCISGLREAIESGIDCH